jgi:hypothetical protein
MSMQICVLADSLLTSIAEWQKAIDAEGFPLRLSDADPDRNLAAQLREEETSIEYGVHDFLELKEVYKNVSFGHDWTYAIAFTWSSDFAEQIATWMAAAAYASATRGVIFDEQEGTVRSSEETLKVIHEIEQRRPEMEAILQNYIERVSAKSPEADAAVRDFMQRRLGKSSRA